MSELAIDILNQIREAESCGLVYTGDEKYPFIGDNKAWAKYNDGEFGNEFNN